MRPRTLFAVCLAFAIRADAATVIGKITVLGTRAPLGGVTVRLKQRSVLLKSTLTNADGTYRVDGLPAGEVSAEYQLAGYQDNPVVRTVKLTSTKPSIQDVRMIAEDESDAYYVAVAEAIAAEDYNPQLVQIVRRLSAAKAALVEARWRELAKGDPDHPGMRYARFYDVDPVVIAAGEIIIRRSEFESALKTLPVQYQQYAIGPGAKQFAEDFLRMKMLASVGMKAGLDKDPHVVQQLALMRENLVANAQLKKIEEGIKLTDEDLEKVYNANKNQYEHVKARHILIAFKGSPAAQDGKLELTEEQAKAKAEELRKQIVAGTANFEELAQKESDDVGSGSRGGDLGEFNRGQMVPEFEKVAFEAKVGDVTPVVRTQFGYHIIKVDEHGYTPFDEVKTLLSRDARQARLQVELEKLKAAAKPMFNDAYFGRSPTASPGDDPKKQ